MFLLSHPDLLRLVSLQSCCAHNTVATQASAPFLISSSTTARYIYNTCIHTYIHTYILTYLLTYLLTCIFAYIYIYSQDRRAVNTQKHKNLFISTHLSSQLTMGFPESFNIPITVSYRNIRLIHKRCVHFRDASFIRKAIFSVILIMMPLRQSAENWMPKQNKNFGPSIGELDKRIASQKGKK